MSVTTISFAFRVEDDLTDVTSALLSDPTNTFGVRRVDTLATVVANDTPLVRVSVGQYSYTLTDPAPGLTYNYWVEVAYEGATYHFQKTKSADPLAAAPTYASLTDAALTAATLPTSIVPNYRAATDDSRLLALQLATVDIDAAGPWQGRTVAADQVLQFPRVPYPRQSALGASGGTYYPPPTSGETVWDWDVVSNAPVVPVAIRQATLFQADYLLAPGAAQSDARRQAIRDGLTAQAVGGMSESYAAGAAPGSFAAAIALLTPRANQLLTRYRLRSGRLL